MHRKTHIVYHILTGVARGKVKKVLGVEASRITGLPEGGTVDAAEWLREKESDPLNVPAFGREDRGGFWGMCGLAGISFYVCRSYLLVLSAFFLFFFFLFFLFFFLGRLGSRG